MDPQGTHAAIQDATSRSLVLSPDPTKLTNDLVDKAREEGRRELQSHIAILEAKIASVQAILEARLTAMDEAQRLVHANVTRIPSETDTAIRHVRELMQEQRTTNDANHRRLDADVDIARREHGDIRKETSEAIANAVASLRNDITVQNTHMAQTVSVQNAHMAQTVNRIESVATRQIEQAAVLLQTAVSGLQSKIDDLKERVGMIEGRTAGITAATTNQREVVKTDREGGQYVLAIVAGIIGVIGVITAIMVAVMRT